MNKQIGELIPIENKNGQQAVNARHLYIFLNVKKDFSEWIKTQIRRCDLSENADYQILLPQGGKIGRGRPLVEYALSLNAAKEISMMSQTERGKQARRYFIECERIAKELTLASYQIEDPIERAKRWIAEQEEKKLLECKTREQKLLIEQQETRIELQDRELKDAAPKVSFYDEVMQSADTMTTTQVAKSIGMEANALNRKLRDIGILYRQSGMWMLCAPY